MTPNFDTLYIHVGDIKSGTTSIQTALAAGCIPPSDKTVHYPGGGLNHYYIARQMKQDTPEPALRRLVAQMEKAKPADICILSGESMSTMKPEELKAGVDRHFGHLARRIEVIHYIRPHLPRALSAYAEMVKIGATAMELPAFLSSAIKRRQYCHANRLGRWAPVFDGAYHIRTMLPGQIVRDDVVVDFFQLVLGAVPEDWTPPRPTNESLSAEGLAQVARLQARLTGQSRMVRHTMGYEFAARYNAITAGEPRSRPGIGAPMAARLQKLFGNDAALVDERLFGGTPHFADSLARDIPAARKGVIRPLQLPEDPRATAISDELIATLADQPDPVKLAAALRRSRTKEMIDEARPLAAAV